jgi:hypothetical protein
VGENHDQGDDLTEYCVQNQAEGPEQQKTQLIANIYDNRNYYTATQI